jgi:hypothetical protein
MKKSLIVISFAIIFFSSCTKGEKGICGKIANITITSNSPVTIGGTITFGTQEVGNYLYRSYNWTGPNHYEGHNPGDSITFTQLENEGWYYLNLYSLNGDYCSKYDSVYIDVKLQQGTPPCSLTANTSTFNNMASDIYNPVVKKNDPGLSLKVLTTVWPSQKNIGIYFHPHWNWIEPEDGIYTTYDIPVWGQTDFNYNQLYIETTKQSLSWTSRIGQSVYVSHVNGKLQVRFCNLNMASYNGTNFTTIASGNVLEL